MAKEYIPSGERPDDPLTGFDEAKHLLIMEAQPSVVLASHNQHKRYVELCGYTQLPGDKWMEKEEYLIANICRGLGFPEMKLSDIINQALVKGCIENAEFHDECEKGLGITESE